MAPPAQQQPTSTNREKKPYVDGAWRQVGHGRWTRECAGGEKAVSYNQNVRDGHTELTIDVPFSTSLSTPELIQRVRNAWLVCHCTHPEVAIQVSTGTELPQRMLFEALQSEADAAAWLRESLHIVTDQNAQDVVRMTYNRRLQTNGKRNMLYLVTAGAADPEHPDRHWFVWNFSHTLADIYSIVRFYNYLFKTITHVPGDRDMAVAELDYSGLHERLPVTPITPYEDEHKPTRAQREQAVAGAIEQAELHAFRMSQSIAMYPEPDAASRSHGTHCIRLQYTLSESQALLAALQDHKLSITFAAAAATILSIKQAYGKGHETGALLGMTRNARRWVHTELHEEGGYRVPAAADTVFIWIPFKPEWFTAGCSTRDTILHLGRAIRAQLGPHLTSPHYIASMSFAADQAVSSLAAEGEPVPAPQAPGFSPQGALPLLRDIASETASIQTHDFAHTGRQINPSAWVGMFSLWERVTLSMGFDVKYYDPVNMEAFMARVKGNLATVIPGRVMGAKL
ncbi:hypothetical protein BDW62DRAFT_210487 [Aspergillus aurantiobrunneus]